MSLFLMTGQPQVFPADVEIDLGKIVNMDLGIGEQPAANSMGLLLQVTYTRHDNGIPAQRIDTLVNTDFHISTAHFDIIVAGVHSNFMVPDGSGNMIPISNVAGETFQPNTPGNPSTSILVAYDVAQCNNNGYWVVGVSGNNISFPGDVILYHELSHALHMANGTFSTVSATEEHNAEVDENDERDQDHLEHRDVNSHVGGCGGGPPSCCIVASIATGPWSQEVGRLRQVRDHYLRRGRIGVDFFERLHHDYYAFSPEVCRAMARSNELLEAIAMHLVQPLLSMLAVFDSYVSAPNDLEALGRVILERAALCPAATPAAVLVQLPELQSPWIEWGLIEPIRLWAATLAKVQEQTDPARLGHWMTGQFEDWAMALPLSPIWQQLSSAELAEELDELSRILLRTDYLRGAFAARLRREIQIGAAGRHPARSPFSGGGG